MKPIPGKSIATSPHQTPPRAIRISTDCLLPLMSGWTGRSQHSAGTQQRFVHQQVVFEWEVGRFLAREHSRKFAQI